MNRYQRQILDILTAHKARLTTTGKHDKWTLPDGRSYTIAKTESDWRAHANQLSDLKRLLGLTKTQFTEGTRRPKKHTERQFGLNLRDIGQVAPRPEPPVEIPRDKHFPANIHGAIVRPGRVHLQPREYRLAGPVASYSPEVVAHANYLLRTQGQESSTKYLNSVRNGVQDMTEQIGQGSIETALRDAEEKQKHFEAEAQKMTFEAQRWGRIVEQLQGAMDALQGTARPSVASTWGGRRKADPADWLGAVERVLDQVNGPIDYKTMRFHLRKVVPDRSEGSYYAAIAKAKKAGLLADDNGKLTRKQQASNA